MALLKEDGRLDVEGIQKLPYKEYLHEICSFTKEQYEEYTSKLPKKEPHETVTPIFVEDVEEYLRMWGYVNAWDVINKL